MTLGGFERQRGGLAIATGIDVVRGDDRLTVERVTLAGGGDGHARPGSITSARVASAALRLRPS